MSGDGLFRDEAVREYLRGRDERQLLRLSPRWLDAVFVLLALVAAAALAFVALVPLDTEVSGPARLVTDADGRAAVVAVFDAAAAARVAPGQALRFVLPALPPSPPLRVERVERGATERLVRVRAPLPGPTLLPAGLDGSAVVVTGRRTLLASALAELRR